MRGKAPDDRQLILMFIYLATSSAILGTGLVFATLFACAYLAIDISRNYWLLAIPVVLTLILNVILIEAVQRIRRG